MSTLFKKYKQYKIGAIIGIFIPIFSVSLFYVTFPYCGNLAPEDNTPWFCAIDDDNLVVRLTLSPLMIMALLIIIFQKVIEESINISIPAPLIILMVSILFGSLGVLIEKIIREMAVKLIAKKF